MTDSPTAKVHRGPLTFALRPEAQVVMRGPSNVILDSRPFPPLVPIGILCSTVDENGGREMTVHTPLVYESTVQSEFSVPLLLGP